MDINVHIRRVEKELSSKLSVVEVERPFIRRLPSLQNRAAVKVRLHFYDGSYLDIDETVDTSKCFPNPITYSYQYIKNGIQVFRYDNARHYPEIHTFPHHKHIGPDDSGLIEASEKPSHQALFREIVQYLDRE